MVEADVPTTDDRVDDPQGAVVQGGITPHQDCPHPSFWQFVDEGPLDEVGPGVVPSADLGGVVGGIAVAWRVGHLDKPVPAL